MALITSDQLALVAQGELAALAELDARGIILGPGETPAAFADRVSTLARNIAELKQELSRSGRVEFLGARLEQKDAIPPEVFASARDRTQAFYRFAVDWVPGFFSNYQMGLLFAGCAYYSFDDFFALFIVRATFRERERWLLYSRTELMSHELSHIAHVAFRSRRFEEILAYQTSESAFRRVVGGFVRTPRDSYLVLGGVFALLAAQIANVVLIRAGVFTPNTIPTWPLFVLGLLPLVCLAVRHVLARRQFLRALERCRLVFGEAAGAVLFRCADEEVAQLAALDDADAVTRWVDARSAAELRWRLIRHRFAPSASSNLNPVAAASP